MGREGGSGVGFEFVVMNKSQGRYLSDAYPKMVDGGEWYSDC